MVLEAVRCPNCHNVNVVKHGKTAQRKQRYLCRNQNCNRSTFIGYYSYRAYDGEVKQKIAEMAINGSGIRDTARVLKISRNTVAQELKKTATAATDE